METTSKALIEFTPQSDTVFIALREQAQGLLRYAEALVIKEAKDLVFITNELSLIAKLKKGVEEKRQEYISPLNNHIKAINGAFKLLTEPLAEADKITRQKILAYNAEIERQRAEQESINRLRMEAAQKEMELKGEITEPVDLVKVSPEAPKRIFTEMGAVGTTKVWKFEVIDFSLLPDDYKLPDMVKIRKVVMAGASVPGVKAWQEDSLRITTKKED